MAINHLIRFLSFCFSRMRDITNLSDARGEGVYTMKHLVFLVWFALWKIEIEQCKTNRCHNTLTKAHNTSVASGPTGSSAHFLPSTNSERISCSTFFRVSFFCGSLASFEGCDLSLESFELLVQRFGLIHILPFHIRILSVALSNRTSFSVASFSQFALLFIR